MLLVLVAGEVALRLLMPRPDREPEQEPAPLEEVRTLSADPDPELAWIFPPLSEGSVWSGAQRTEVRTDHLGLRNPRARTGRDPDKRIIVLGDSYAFGWGVQEDAAFPRQLERMVQERYPGIEVSVSQTTPSTTSGSSDSPPTDSRSTRPS